jgi:hypothetical protein
MTCLRAVRPLVVAAGGIGLLVAGAAGCRSGPPRHPAPSTPVTGTFREVGGPAPGIDRPLAGEILVYEGASSRGTQVNAAHSDASGRFRLVLGPGTFFFVGRSPSVAGALCTSDGPVTLSTAPRSVAVTCSIP